MKFVDGSREKWWGRLTLCQGGGVEECGGSPVSEDNEQGAVGEDAVVVGESGKMREKRERGRLEIDRWARQVGGEKIQCGVAWFGAGDPDWLPFYMGRLRVAGYRMGLRLM
jgi:hypothetical protein